MNAEEFFKAFVKEADRKTKYILNEEYRREPSLNENNGGMKDEEVISLKKYTKDETGKTLFYFFKEKEKEYTYIVNKIIVDSIIKKAGLWAQHEYFRIDSVGWNSRYQEYEEKTKKVGLNSHLWDLQIAVEHENSKTDWIDEVMKLIHVKCPLKVMIAYNYCNCRDIGNYSDRNRLQVVAQMMKEVKAFKEGQDEEYLVILGNGKCKKNKGDENIKDYDNIGFDYRGYVYNRLIGEFEVIN